MIQNKLKKYAALAALEYVNFDSVIGIGSGSTMLYFIQELYHFRTKIIGTVSSSYYTTLLLQNHGIKVLDVNTVSDPIIYIDSADEVNFDMYMIKGGGGALTKEKIISSLSNQFICIIDESKLVHTLGQFPLPIEIIPESYSYIYQEVLKLGGIPKYRNGIVTDHGNIIIDIYNLNLQNPQLIENYLNSLAGIVTVGLFRMRKNDLILISTQYGIKSF
ncbi:Ribose-5-phosphate isomerase A [Buchnera aphidicola (Pterocallis alni)]|uniref:ribose-5-phosphate isomerase RpiA n=1 Tax=Buchnera aphidicola TaxID=9 RepID=UPI00346394A0